MIGSSVLGGFVFLISDSMFSTAFDVLIKILKVYRHHNLKDDSSTTGISVIPMDFLYI